jgi:malonyl-CoA/methylmalonyl-CoA synthetase
VSENLFDHLRAGFPADLARPALRHPDGRTVSYADVLNRSAQVAAVLRYLGIPAGARVSVQVDKCEDFLMLYLGCLRAGTPLVPINPSCTVGEVGYYVRDSGAEIFLCQPEHLAEVEGSARDAGARHVYTFALDGEAGSFQRLAAQAGASPDGPSARVNGQEPLAAILYTSGTTGAPKGAMLTHDNLVANTDALHSSWGWRADDVLLHALPLFHVHGLFVAATAALGMGAEMIFLPRLDPDLVVKYLPESTLFMGVPTMYHRLAQEPRITPELCRSVRLFVSGSAPLSVADFTAFKERTGHAILERYGMTETGMNVSNPLEGERKPGKIGFPLPGVEARLVDPETLMDAGEGEVGEIWVRGRNVFAGYFHAPEKTAESFVDGWFRTGDLGRRDADGYYEIVGRAKDLIITGGLNVYPAEVEQALGGIEGVEDVAVIGLPDPDWGEQVTAVIIPRPGSQLTPEAVMTSARSLLAPYKCPRRVELVDALPRNAMGKVEKARLRQTYSA